jgi:ribosome-associated translation inhibitor RaiA
MTMQSPLEITFRGMAPSASVEGAIHRWVARLERSYDRVHRCSVLVELPHQHRRHGNQFHVRVDLTVPGREIAVSRDPACDPGHEDVYVAISDAFRVARRQLQDHARTSRGDIKTHEA